MELPILCKGFSELGRQSGGRSDPVLGTGSGSIPGAGGRRLYRGGRPGSLNSQT